MRLNKFVPFLLALVIHLLPLGYFLFIKNNFEAPGVSQNSHQGVQGIDLTGFSTTKKKSTPGGLKPTSSVSPTSPSLKTGTTGATDSAVQSSSPGTIATSGSGTGSPETLILSSVDPVYPPLARQKGLEGSVRLKARYDNQGVITQVDIVNSSGTKMLDESAKKALMSWKLKAGSEGSFEKTFQFKLNN